MRRPGAVLWALLGPVLGAAVLALGTAVPAYADDPGTITSYVSDYTLSPEGDLTVVETITVDFPDPRHGIFRTFQPPDNGQVRGLPDRHTITASRDGESVRTALANQGEGLRVTLGDPDVEITGEHVYEIRYAVDDAVVAGDDEYGGEHHPFTEFYGDTIGADWELPILPSEVTVHLPGKATDGSCGAGYDGTEQCEGVGTDTIRYRTGRLEPGTPVSVRVDYEVSGTDSATGVYVESADQDSDDPGPLGLTTAEALIGAVPLALIGGGTAYYRVRRRATTRKD